MYLQVCDIIHDRPAFNRMPLSVDEVVVDLKETEVPLKDKESRCTVSTEQINTHNRNITIKAKYKHGDGVLTLWKTSEVDLVKASAAISQWILNTLYLLTSTQGKIHFRSEGVLYFRVKSMKYVVY